MKVKQLDNQGKEVAEIEVDDALFGVQPNSTVLSQYVHVHRKRKALGTKKTKSRSEVAGGGKKPWRQKGTGRARHGSIRSPLWVGGGHTHAIVPTLNKRVSITKKLRKNALASALSIHVKDGSVSFVEIPTWKKPKTADFVKLLANISLSGKKLLVVLPEKNVIIEKSIANLPRVSAATANLINAYDVLNAEALLFLGDSFKKIMKGETTDGK